MILIPLLQVRPGCAVSEEDIGAAAAVHPQKSTHLSNQTEQSASSNTGGRIQSADANASAPVRPAPESRPLAPRATFPYTIRAGDSLGLIGSEFGISVADLVRVNHLNEDAELVVGDTLRIPNPWVARERELTSQIDQLSAALQEAQAKARSASVQTGEIRRQVETLAVSNHQLAHDAHALIWWRAAGYVLSALAILMLGVTLLVVIEWLLLRHRFRAVAELNAALRRLDYKYRGALAKAELRLQELYGRRKRGLADNQERPRLAEEAEIEILNRELKAVLEHHLEKLGRPVGAAARRARWRERVGGIGSPIEAREVRR